MWSQKKKNGKYQYFERYKDPLTGKNKITSITIEGNRRTDQKAAERVLEERIRQLIQSEMSEPDMTFGELVTRYLAYQAETLKPQTVAINTMKFRSIRRGIGDDSLVSSLNAPYVRHALAADSPVTYNEHLKHFKACIRWAYREEIISDISFLERLPKLKEPTPQEKDAQKYLEKDELQKLLAGMKEQDWELLTRFLVLTGLRIGELIALTTSDVDLSARSISITKTYSTITKAISSAKTDSSVREIYVQDDLLPVCREIFARRRYLEKTFGTKSNLFFPDIDGGYMQYAAYAKYLRENTEKLIGRALSPHALRHTHVALLAENGIPLEVISRRLGHSNSTITKEVYFHVTSRLKDRDKEAIKSVSLF